MRAAAHRYREKHRADPEWRAKRALQQRKYYDPAKRLERDRKNATKINARNRAWRNSHKDRVAAYFASHYQRNKARRDAYIREWRKLNPEKRAAASRRYRENKHLAAFWANLHQLAA